MPQTERNPSLPSCMSLESSSASFYSILLCLCVCPSMLFNLPLVPGVSLVELVRLKQKGGLRLRGTKKSHRGDNEPHLYLSWRHDRRYCLHYRHSVGFIRLFKVVPNCQLPQSEEKDGMEGTPGLLREGDRPLEFLREREREIGD